MRRRVRIRALARSIRSLVRVVTRGDDGDVGLLCVPPHERRRGGVDVGAPCRVYMQCSSLVVHAAVVCWHGEASAMR